MKASTVAPENIEVPVGVPQTFDEHIKLQFDLLALAFQADITRVGTLLFARDLTGRTYPESEAPTSGFHGVSHHGEDPRRIAELSKINQYHVKMVAYLVDTAGEDAGRRRHAARSVAGALRQQHGQLEPARALRRAARARRRAERQAEGRAPPGLSDQDRCRPATCCSASSTSSTSTRTASATAPAGWRRCESCESATHVAMGLRSSRCSRRRGSPVRPAPRRQERCRRRGDARRRRRPCARCWPRRPTSTRRRTTARRRCTGRCIAATPSWSNLLMRAGANAKAANREGVDAAVAGQRQRRRRRSIGALLEAGADAEREAAARPHAADDRVAHRQRRRR